ncbi:phage antirepressor [Halalkalibacter hemicellulosilyticus]|uniref:Phage antirepressor protein n=1 Tax=Halalkalibacter hemicellulosilyticusJCM 9152 TaxID=1236971 RepID=W4QLC9_9BACI|nr:phage antirepressor KilAC domain-containing protein [Halalkalibacter hemicellulosilyticus]GAE32428.1 phage antirepressor protein [Halalkalibacter hemicellulosilyticusJCM 9152]
MNQLQKVFDYENQAVRTIVIDGEAWFVAKDVCQILDIKRTDSALRRLSDKQKGAHHVSTPGGKQLLSIVNEAGLYKLIFRSDKEEAEVFTDWVTEQVLPTIRKTGRFDVQPSYMIENPVERAKQWIEEQKKVQLLEQRAAIYEEKANYVDEILKSKNTVTTTQIAKDYGMSARTLNQILKEEGIQFKQRGQWLLKSTYHDKGYTKSYTVDIERSDGTPDVRMNTHWTQRGRLFIHRVLEKRGIVAMMDQELMSG